MLLGSSGSAGSQCHLTPLSFPQDTPPFASQPLHMLFPIPSLAKPSLRFRPHWRHCLLQGLSLIPQVHLSTGALQTQGKREQGALRTEKILLLTEIPIRHAGRSPRASTAQLNKPEGQQRTLWLMAHGSHTPSYQHVILAQGKPAAGEDRQSFPAGLPACSPLSEHRLSYIFQNYGTSRQL